MTNLRKELELAKKNYESKKYDFAITKYNVVAKVIDFVKLEYKLIDVEDAFLDEIRINFMGDDCRYNGKDVYEYSNSEIEELLNEKQLQKYINYINDCANEFDIMK